MKDNYDFFEDHEREIARRLSHLPVCRCCGEPITSERAYDVDGLYCQQCFDEWVEDIAVEVEEEVDEW